MAYAYGPWRMAYDLLRMVLTRPIRDAPGAKTVDGC